MPRHDYISKSRTWVCVTSTYATRCKFFRHTAGCIFITIDVEQEVCPKASMKPQYSAQFFDFIPVSYPVLDTEAVASFVSESSLDKLYSKIGKPKMQVGWPKTSL
jgi:hypothetical protein